MITLLIAPMRSGGTLLAQLLTDARVAYLREWLHHEASQASTIAGHAAYIQQQHAHDTWQSTGLKLHYDAALRLSPRDPSGGMLRLLDALGGDARAVHLIRQDKVAQAVSLYRAEHTGVWGRGVNEAPEASDLAYDSVYITRRVHKFRTEERWWSRWLQQHSVPHITLTYETYTADLATTWRRLSEHLGFRASLPPVKWLPTHDPRQAALIARYKAEHGH